MDQNQNTGLFGLEVDDISSQNLISASKWAKFLAIVGIVFLGLLLLFILVFGDRMSVVLSAYIPGMDETSALGVLTVVIVLICLIAGIMLFLLLRAALLINKGINNRDIEVFNNGIASLKTYFIIYGVLAILGLLVNLTSLF